MAERLAGREHHRFIPQDTAYWEQVCQVPGSRIISFTEDREKENYYALAAKRKWAERLAEEAKLIAVKKEAAEETRTKGFDPPEAEMVRIEEVAQSPRDMQEMDKAARDEQRAREGDDNSPRSTADTWEGTAADLR